MTTEHDKAYGARLVQEGVAESDVAELLEMIDEARSVGEEAVTEAVGLDWGALTHNPAFEEAVAGLVMLQVAFARGEAVSITADQSKFRPHRVTLTVEMMPEDDE